MRRELLCFLIAQLLRKLRGLTVVDIFFRFPPALVSRFTFRGTDVVEILERVARK